MPDPAPPPPPGDLERTLKQSADTAEAARAASQEADVEGPLKPPKIPGYQVMEPIGRGRSPVGRFPGLGYRPSSASATLGGE